MLIETTENEDELSPDRAWWLRVPAVLLSPRSVFFALREDDPDDVAARSEPILLITWLAGASAVLATPAASRLLDGSPARDGLDVALWTFIFGGIYGAAGYFFVGFALFFGARLFGSLGDFRRERQLVGFALVPLALSLLVLLPLRLAVYGSDSFRTGGADAGTGEDMLLAAQLVFVAWSFALLLTGVRVTHGWNWLRSTAVVAAGAALLGAFLGIFVAFL